MRDDYMDKAETNDYRTCTDWEVCCRTCTEKQAVPRWWCDHVGRQVEAGKVCDNYKRVA